MPRARSRNALLLGASAALLACAPATAAAHATLTTDARCYAPGAPLRMTADGLTPRAPLTVALDGRRLTYGDGTSPAADAAGSFASSFAVPALAPAAVQQGHRLVVSDGTHRPHARFAVSRPAGGDFQPASGDPRTLQARVRVWGFALGDKRPAGRLPVWLHWVSPAGKPRRSAALGSTGGPCGALTTAPRRVFPFAPEPGRWTLVIDTHRRYRVHASGPRAKIPVHVRAR
ncbi:MAG: hypothetical protein JSS99_15730 [Actinobacteria bacterium]|nr:hypothetical protein [Actinomycetota bacterium]